MVGLIQRYANYLPVTNKTPFLTLHEGSTPLLLAENLSEELDLELYLKVEGLNPTGSFKDRGMVMAVAKALEEGSHTIICASTGNTSASAAAYAAKANMKCIVLVPDGHVAMGKLAQAMIYGAEILSLKGNFDQALTLVKEITSREPVTLVNSLNPYRIQGQKTAAFEIIDELGAPPHILALPVGNAGNISAYWQGFIEYKERGHSNTLPKMYGFQAAGAAPIVEERVFEHPETVATAIRIGNPASWDKATQAVHDSKGLIESVTDEEILDAYRLLARTEGVFAEPASAAPLAGIKKLKALGKLEKGIKIVCILTGNGLKDPDIIVQSSPELHKVNPNYKEIMSIINRA